MTYAGNHGGQPDGSLTVPRGQPALRRWRRVLIAGRRRGIRQHPGLLLKGGGSKTWPLRAFPVRGALRRDSLRNTAGSTMSVTTSGARHFHCRWGGRSWWHLESFLASNRPLPDSILSQRAGDALVPQNERPARFAPMPFNPRIAHGVLSR